MILKILNFAVVISLEWWQVLGYESCVISGGDNAGKQCKFPFKEGKGNYTSCLWSPEDQNSFCYHHLNSNLTGVPGSRGICDSSCPYECDGFDFWKCNDKCIPYNVPCGRECPYAHGIGVQFERLCESNKCATPSRIFTSGFRMCENQCIGTHINCNNTCLQGMVLNCESSCDFPTKVESFTCNGTCQSSSKACNGQCLRQGHTEYILCPGSDYKCKRIQQVCNNLYNEHTEEKHETCSDMQEFSRSFCEDSRWIGKPLQCYTGEIRCSGHRQSQCITKDKVCDGKFYHCMDRSDETNCPENIHDHQEDFTTDDIIVGDKDWTEHSSNLIGITLPLANKIPPLCEENKENIQELVRQLRPCNTESEGVLGLHV